MIRLILTILKCYLYLINKKVRQTEFKTVYFIAQKQFCFTQCFHAIIRTGNYQTTYHAENRTLQHSITRIISAIVISLRYLNWCYCLLLIQAPIILLGCFQTIFP